MYTEANYYTKDRRLVARTRTWNKVKLTGFTGGVAVGFFDKDQKLIGFTDERAFGVDGTWIGKSNRWDNWEVTLPDEPWTKDIRGIAILHTHAGKNRLGNILEEAKRHAKTVKEIIQIVGSVTPKD